MTEDQLIQMVDAIKGLNPETSNLSWVANLLAKGAELTPEERSNFFSACNLEDIYEHSVGSMSSNWLNP